MQEEVDYSVVPITITRQIPEVVDCLVALIITLLQIPVEALINLQEDFSAIQLPQLVEQVEEASLEDNQIIQLL